MLALSFFIFVFSSILWGIYSIFQVVDKLGASGLATAGIFDIFVHVAFILVPIFLVWVIFGIISQYLHNQNFNRNLFYLLNQMKKNQDYSDLLARIMLEGEQQLKDGFAIQQFDLFVSDMNELISEVIHRSSLASAEQIDRLWSKVRNGGKWAFGKVIIEVYQNQPSFQMRILEKAISDKVLAGTIMEFCSRYLGTVDLFEKHDHEKIFLGIIENGVLGKVYSILSPVSDELRRKRNVEVKQNPRPDLETQIKTNKAENRIIIDDTVEEQIQKAPAVVSTKEPVAPVTSSGKFNLSSTLAFFKKKKDTDFTETSAEKDMLSIALERSFGEQTLSRQEPSFEKYENDLPATIDHPEMISEPDSEPAAELVIAAREDNKIHNKRPPFAEISNTQKTLNNLRKEWEDIKKAEGSSYGKTATPISANKEEDGIVYPFGGWMNEDNYHK